MIKIKTAIRLIVLGILFMSGVFIHADTDTASEQNSNTNSDENLQTLQSMMPKVCYFSGEFVQSKLIKTLPVPLMSEGEFVYSCELGLIWKTQRPIIESLVFTNKKLYFLVSENLIIENLEGVQHDFLANLLLGLMSGNTEFISKEFEILEVVNEKKNLILKPKSKFVKQAIKSVILKTLSNTNGLEIIISDKNQQITKIVSSEKQQFTSSDDFSKNCMSFAVNSCKVLLHPVRISSSGKN